MLVLNQFVHANILVLNVPRRSQTFSAVHLASLLLGYEGNWTTYSTVALPVTTLMDWLKKGGFDTSSSLHMTVVAVQSRASPVSQLSAVNSAIDFLYRGLGTTVERLGSYAFYSFYEKRKAFESKRTKDTRQGRPRQERARLHRDHPQASTYELMRVDPPRVPKIIGPIPVQPDGFFDSPTGVTGDAQSPPDEKELAARDEYALFVLALFCDLHASRPIVVANGESWWTICLDWWRANVEPSNRAWMKTVLSNINDVRTGDQERFKKTRLRYDSGSDSDEEVAAMPASECGSDTDDEFILHNPDTKMKTKNRGVKPEELAELFDKLAGLTSHPKADETKRDFERATADILKSAAIARAAKQAGLSSTVPAKARRLPPGTSKERMERWSNDVKCYDRSAAEESQPPTIPSHDDEHLHEPFIAGVTDEPGGASRKAIRGSDGRWREPSWTDIMTPPPSIAEASHMWVLNRLQSLAFFIMASRFLEMQKNDDDPGSGPRLDCGRQLRLIVNGEAGVGKSQVIRCFMWFSHQHRRARELVVTAFQGRPVANLRNPAVKGMTSSMLANINSMGGNIARRGGAMVNKLQRTFRPLSFIINDELSQTAADHFDAMNRQSPIGLADRAVPDAVFGGLNVVLAMDVKQHKPVNGKAVYAAAGGSAFRTARDGAAYNARKLKRETAGMAAYNQFDKVRHPPLLSPALFQCIVRLVSQ